jgi:hypothetical protein
MKKLSILGLSAATALLCAVPVSLQMSQNTLSISLDKASARVGNPLSAGSVAGVHRRAARRTARSAYTGGYGYGIGTGIGVAAAGVAASNAYPSYGYGVAAAGVERRMARREERRAYYGDQFGYGSGLGFGAAAAAGAVATSAAASTAYGTWGAGMHTANVAYYPTRAIYARDYRTPTYYGPVCSPRFDLGCQ